MEKIYQAFHAIVVACRGPWCCSRNARPHAVQNRWLSNTLPRPLPMPMTYQYRYSGKTNAYPKNILDNMVGQPAARPAVQAWGRRLMEVAVQRPPHTAQPTGQANTGTGIGIMLVLALGYFRRPAHSYGHMSLQFNSAGWVGVLVGGLLLFRRNWCFIGTKFCIFLHQLVFCPC